MAHRAPRASAPRKFDLGYHPLMIAMGVIVREPQLTRYAAVVTKGVVLACSHNFSLPPSPPTGPRPAPVPFGWPAPACPVGSRAGGGCA